MPKNKGKYRYFDVGLILNSWTLGKLEQDAELHQMDDIPAKLIALRLTEYYRLTEASPLILSPATKETRVPPEKGSTPPASKEEEPSEKEEPSPSKGAPGEPDIADESADFWGTL